jgi:hypothetical protein
MKRDDHTIRASIMVDGGVLEPTWSQTSGVTAPQRAADTLICLPALRPRRPRAASPRSTSRFSASWHSTPSLTVVALLRGLAMASTRAFGGPTLRRACAGRDLAGPGAAPETGLVLT